MSGSLSTMQLAVGMGHDELEGAPGWTTLPGTTAPTPYPMTRPATQANNRNKRISEEGYRLVDEMYRLNPYPSTSQKRETLQRILALPGCEHYKFENLNQRLAAHRKRDGITGSGPSVKAKRASLPRNTHIAPNPSSAEEILYPSIAGQDGIKAALHILLRESPIPTPYEVTLWAKRLGCHLDDVQTWIDHQRDKLQKESSKPIVTSQLPTPGSSCSPEPTSPVQLQTPVMQEVPAPPKLEREDQTESKSRTTLFSGEQFRDLAEKVHVARTDAGTQPSAEDAARALEEHSQRMTAFLERYERGDYAAIGLTPQFLSRGDQSMTVKSEPMAQPT
ncbi:uncharacterized protein C8Q71DRAFT_775140 [Rhodofomes roseus]|uniref:Homeobox KN domain-containing protein n=1 Tax=Rhodofomes roseus TaxID=34475 RepID=A0ABQ8K842_9APHY|nr:uncharacterized protein C8Q71DRAFT_775140 [Rhodofomes roseus]KAH9833342.1 hypothetical protein C8Q71DRAFT_775140 [Rhodofomes roseus]